MIEGIFYTNQGSGNFIKGNDVNVTPTLEEEYEIYGVGDEYETYGYKMPITVNGPATNIVLSEPLRKIEDHIDYIDFKNNKEIRNVEELIITGKENGIPITLIIVGLMYLGSEIYSGTTVADNVSHITHIIGGISGAVLGMFFKDN